MIDMARMVVWLRETLDAAQEDAEAATCGPWHVTEYVAGSDYGFDAGVGTAPGEVDVVGHGYEGGGCERVQDARHIARHSPVAVLRQIAADRELLDDLLAETHHVLHEDSWYRCSAANRAGERYNDQRCDCGRDDRVERRVRLLAEGWGWTEARSAPECMCTPTGECGRCREKRQEAPKAHAIEGATWPPPKPLPCPPKSSVAARDAGRPSGWWKG